MLRLSSDRWVMYYTGYGLFGGAVLGSSHGKYGPSTYALRHAVQSLIGPSMDAYLATNRLLSAATPAVLAALRACVAFLGAPPRSAPGWRRRPHCW